MTTTFAYIASKSAKKASKPRVVKAAFGDGYALRVKDGINTSPEMWDLSFNNLPDVHANAIEDFFEARGASESFYWTTPRGVQKLFVCPEWNRTQNKEDSSSITTKFEQVYG